MQALFLAEGDYSHPYHSCLHSTTSAGPKLALEELHNQLNDHPEGVVIVAGDFNHHQKCTFPNQREKHPKSGVYKHLEGI